MKKIIVFLSLIIICFLTSCSLIGNTTVYETGADATVIVVKNEVSDVVANVESSCVGIYCTLSTTSASTGSGVVIKKDGFKYYAITNYHVIEEADEVNVYINNSVFIKSSVIATNPDHDLALLKFEAADSYGVTASPLPTDDIIVNVGEKVIAIGCPVSLTVNFNTVTVGYVSNVTDNYSINHHETNDNVKIIQHDAAINNGNSGGALFNINGDLIGINYQKTTKTSSGTIVEGLGYAIHYEVVKELVNKARI